ncbi:PQQ-dependent sugar dehydrogenase [Spirosoma fluviale]|uniref:Glucose/arabinose dehydrogenase, beta-propeller fold n=1 Tax=Spirosoma fluviale TaxID=1597977 RepID=A0A286FA07_9BACT|nr:PQQ-dependent sugar dehydrogenase [Spirosoma fluviale]SOD79674.1 Glucose/arabinose dehydrogenase, beta-propeller fold [Spirosoma fluviale]
MLKFTISAAFAAVFLLSSFLIDRKPVAKTARENYTTYCSSCHGEKVEAFVDRKWKHGNAKSDLTKSISEGYPDLGMPTWKATLSASEIDALADLITESLKTVDQYKFTSKPTSNLFPSEGQTVKLDTIATGLSSPWGLAFLPNDELLITDRSGDIYRVDKSHQKVKVTGGPTVLAEGQGGLLDVVLHPDFAKNQLVYFSYSAVKTEGDQKLSTTAVMCAKLTGTTLTDQKVIFEALPYSKTRHHYGSRMTFDNKGYLFVSVGERGNEKENPQTITNDLGKVHRLHDDGRIPADNPFVNDKTARASIYSYGHRNPQGMMKHPVTGDIWTNEHGPRGGDELNIVKKGSNYGWPVISYGINYDGKPITALSAKEGMEQPLTYWLPSIAPSGMVFVNSAKYPGWKNNILIGSLRFQYLNRCVMNGNKVVKQEKLLPNIGRVRNIKQGPDGYLYVSVEDPGYAFRLMPVSM